MRIAERRVRRPPRLRLRIPRDALAFLLRRRVGLEEDVLRRRRVAPDLERFARRIFARYLRKPAFSLPFLRPFEPLRLRRLFIAIFFLPFLVVFFFLKISSKLLLYSSSTIPVVIGLLRYNGLNGVRRP